MLLQFFEQFRYVFRDASYVQALLVLSDLNSLFQEFVANQIPISESLFHNLSLLFRNGYLSFLRLQRLYPLQILILDFAEKVLIKIKTIWWLWFVFQDHHVVKEDSTILKLLRRYFVEGNCFSLVILLGVLWYFQDAALNESLKQVLGDFCTIGVILGRRVSLESLRIRERDLRVVDLLMQLLVARVRWVLIQISLRVGSHGVVWIHIFAIEGLIMRWSNIADLPQWGFVTWDILVCVWTLKLLLDRNRLRLLLIN